MENAKITLKAYEYASEKGVMNQDIIDAYIDGYAEGYNDGINNNKLNNNESIENEIYGDTNEIKKINTWCTKVQTGTLILNQEYIISYWGKFIEGEYRLEKVTEKGYNLNNIETGEKYLKRHLYPGENININKQGETTLFVFHPRGYSFVKLKNFK